MEIEFEYVKDYKENGFGFLSRTFKKRLLRMTNRMIADDYKLSQKELSALYEDGYIGPFEPVLSETEIDDLSKKLLTHSRDKEDKHPLYRRFSVRDWYLVYPNLIRFASHPQVLSQLNSIMGNDLLLWRSHNFYKPPGGTPVGWHQDFGTFSGEDIGNNKPSLLPTHLKHISEDTLRRYLPETLQLSHSDLAPDQSDFWNITVWVALTDISADMGVMRFLKGSHKRRYPVRMGALTESDFWQSPFANIHNKEQLINACNDSQLVLDVDTSQVLNNVNLNAYSYEELKQIILLKLQEKQGSITVSDEVKEEQIVTFPMKKGSYIIFSERTLHGSLANTSDKERLAINFRITKSSTLVYPFRLRGEYFDGFNLDIRHHQSVLLSGKNLNPYNAIMAME
ncbi:MAG: phytanoyl-CoA dioxygenase family protein [Dolichospermum sp.]